MPWPCGFGADFASASPAVATIGRGRRGGSHPRPGENLGAAHGRRAQSALTRALEAGLPIPRIDFLRAQARSLAGDVRGAEADRAEGLRRDPTDELSWIARGVARIAAEPAGAISDFDAALKLNPR